MPFDVAKFIVMVFPEAADIVATRFVDAAFSLLVDTSLIDIVGAGSLSVIVIVPVAVAIVAFDGLDKAIVNVSSTSSSESFVMLAVTVFEVCPAAKVNVVELNAV